MDETDCSTEAAKKMLWLITREWEDVFDGIRKRKIEEGCGATAVQYMQGLENQMSGNEIWSLTTMRYSDRN